MTEADKMFEELGYKRTHTRYIDCEEYFEYIKDMQIAELRIKFSVSEKSVSPYVAGRAGYKPSYLTLQELKAINKKCEELGWL